MDKLKLATDLLDSEGFEHQIVPQEPRIAPVAKTIVFKDSQGTFAAVVLLEDRVSYSKLRELRGRKVSSLHPNSLRGLGWEPGECCPLTIQGPLYVDPSVLKHEIIQTGSGRLDNGLVYKSIAITSLRDDVEVVEVAE